MYCTKGIVPGEIIGNCVFIDWVVCQYIFLFLVFLNTVRINILNSSKRFRSSQVKEKKCMLNFKAKFFHYKKFYFKYPNNVEHWTLNNYYFFIFQSYNMLSITHFCNRIFSNNNTRKCFPQEVLCITLKIYIIIFFLIII